MFTPTTNHQERGEKCTMGLTALLTMAIILLMVADMVPKADITEFPLLGERVPGNGVTRPGLFLVAQIGLISLGTCVGVAIMYLHSEAAFDNVVPDWLLAFVFKSPARVAMRSKEVETDEHIPKRFQESTIGGAAARVGVGARSDSMLQDKLILLHNCLTNVQQIRLLIEEDTVHAELLDLWDRVCFRLDLYALIVFQLVNAIIMFVWLSY
jgi:hypothetical protein